MTGQKAILIGLIDWIVFYTMLESYVRFKMNDYYQNINILSVQNFDKSLAINKITHHIMFL